ncbi:MAG: PilN domain-containing protein [Cellvibrionales bacterium]|nr:PilN domain-containing protein [Cellvibrionales bacterium]
MPQINLLPWREEQREERKRQFLGVLVLMVLLALAIGLAWSAAVNLQIAAQKSRNAMLEAEIATLAQRTAEIGNLQAQRGEILERIQVIKGLQVNRPEIVRLYEQLAHAFPDGVYINKLQFADNTLSMDGKAESNNRISALMRNLDQAEKFASPSLRTVTADSELGEQGSSFHMTAQVVDLGVVASE